MEMSFIGLILLFSFTILGGALCMVVPRNSVIGVRIRWTEYNDETWRKSNNFTGILLIFVGSVSFLPLVMISEDVAEWMFFILMGVAFIASLIYSKKTYDRVRSSCDKKND